MTFDRTLFVVAGGTVDTDAIIHTAWKKGDKKRLKSSFSGQRKRGYLPNIADKIFLTLENLGLQGYVGLDAEKLNTGHAGINHGKNRIRRRSAGSIQK